MLPSASRSSLNPILRTRLRCSLRVVARASPQKPNLLLGILRAMGSGLTGYLIEAKGYADPTENASTKQKLCRDREGDCRFIDPELQLPVQAHGHPVQWGRPHQSLPTKTSAGRSQNRRVDVKVLVTRGLTGGM